jgi:sarcosine oxidase subunit beta
MPPTHCSDVVVIGGGVIGCAIAYWLTELGVGNVVLLEKRVLAGGETGVCPGGIRQQFDREADCVIARHSVQFYEGIAERLESDHPFHFQRSGYLFAAHSPQTLAQYRRNVALQNRLGIPSRMLDNAEVAKLLPDLSTRDLLGATFCGEDGFLEDCHGVTFAFAAAARRRGMRPVLHTEAIAIRDAAAGGWDVHTTRDVFSAPHIVLAAGVDSVPLADAVGLALPIEEVTRRLVFTEPASARRLDPLLVAADRGVAAKQLSSGVFYLGWLRETADADDLTFTEESLTAASSLLPLLADLGVQRVVRGRYDLTPDRRPILGPAAGFPGIHLAAGFSGHGFMIAPAVGELVASMLCGVDCRLPAAPFSLERFDRPPDPESLYI